LLLAHNPHGGEHLKELLVGQILWVNGSQVAWLAAVTAAVLLAMRIGVLRRFGRFGFYGVFAVAVTASVQVVGVYLVFSALIVPALSTRAFNGRRRTAWAYGLGGCGFALGLAASAWLDLPSGALIVWSLALCGLVVALQPAHKEKPAP